MALLSTTIIGPKVWSQLCATFILPISTPPSYLAGHRHKLINADDAAATAAGEILNPLFTCQKI
nr:hypothetical protein Itr_chr11CG23800 [Ipomoea trifida]